MQNILRNKEFFLRALYKCKHVVFEPYNMFNGAVAGMCMGVMIYHVNTGHGIFWAYAAAVKQFLYTGLSAALYSHLIRRSVVVLSQKNYEYPVRLPLLVAWTSSIVCAVLIHGVVPGTPEAQKSILLSVVLTPFAVLTIAIPTWLRNK